MAFCVNCGTSLPEGAKFCPACGTQAAPQAGGGAPVKTAEEWKKEGDAFDNQKNYAEAIRCYNEALAVDPKDGRVYNNRGNTWDNLGEHEKALADYSKAVELRGSVGNYINRGNLFIKLKDYPKAATDFTRAIELAPDMAVCYGGRGNLYALMEDTAAAVKDYEKAVSLEPGNETYKTELAKLKAPAAGEPEEVKLNEKGMVLFKSRHYQEALECFSQALSLSPYNSYYLNRGLTYEKLKDYEKALVDSLRSIELGMDSPIPYRIAASCYQAQGLPKNAAKYFAESARLLNRQEKYAKAFDSSTKALELDPGNAQAYRERGVAAFGQSVNSSAAAREDITRAIAIEPDNADFYAARASVSNDRGEAIEDWDKAIELKDDEWAWYAERAGWNVEYGFEYGGEDSAIEYLTLAIDNGVIEGVYPGLALSGANYYLWRAKTYYEKKMLEQAMADLSMACETSADFEDWAMELLEYGEELPENVLEALR